MQRKKTLQQIIQF